MVRLALSIFALCVAFGCAARAETTAAARDCASIGDSLQRLTCFDRLFPKAEARDDSEAEAAKGQEAIGYWSIRRDRSALDDSPQIIGTLLPIETTASRRGRDSLALMVRCRENITSVLLHTELYLGRSPRVTLRLGTSHPTTATWERSSDNRAAGLWTGAAAIPFLRSLKNNERLVIRVEEEDRVEGIFNLGNVETVRSEIAEACKWTP